MNQTTLYKLDTKGKIRLWAIESVGAEIIQHSGLEDGKMVCNKKTCTSKNVGKSNETSPENQAKLEVQSEIASKLDEGYFRTKKEALSTKVVLPMLAKSFKDEEKKVEWDKAYVQPKLDGMRCLAFIDNGDVELMSRDGKTIQGLDHIRKELSSIKGIWILDGELYAHGKNFQDNMRLIKKYREGETEAVKYHVYDMVDDDCFTVRYLTINTLLKQEVTKFRHLTLVDTVQVKSKEDLVKRHIQRIALGYEGTILRWGDAKYKTNGRSANLLKYKDFIDIAATIIDIEPAVQRATWGVPVLKYNGITFRAGMKYSHEERIEFLTNKHNYIGKTAEVRFFEYSEAGVPRFPIMVGIRLDK